MITLANQIAESWWSWMGPMLWQASLLIVIVSTVDKLIGRWAWPPVRYALWLLVLVKLLIPPTWGLTTSVVSQSVPWAEQIVAGWDGAPPIDLGEPRAAAAADDGLAPALSSAPSGGPPVTTAGLGWKSYAMGIWILGMALFGALLATRIARLRRWHREQDERQTIPPWFHELMVRTAKRLDLDRLPAIVFSDEAVTPAVYGMFRPVMLLPARYTDSLSREEAEHVLLHELAHLKRGDLWMHGICLLLQIVYWFNPLLVWVRKQMRHVREICCDLTVANLLKEKTTAYRKTLLNTAREMLTESLEPGMGLLGVFEDPFRLVARLRWLERNSWRNRGWMLASAALVVLVVAPLLLPMAAVGDSAARFSGDEPITAGPGGSGDVYVKSIARSEYYFFGFRVDSRTRYAEEAWIGDRRAKLVDGDKTLIIDLELGKFWFLNPRRKTYVEASLPLDLGSLLADEVERTRLARNIVGEVRDSGRSRRIVDQECTEYLFTSWDEFDGSQSDPYEARVWASDDGSVDLTAFEELLENMRLVQGRDEALRDELRKIRGKQLRFEISYGNLWKREKFVTEAVEIARKEPRPDVYSVPAEYRRVEQLTPEDF